MSYGRYKQFLFIPINEARGFPSFDDFSDMSRLFNVATFLSSVILHSFRGNFTQSLFSPHKTSKSYHKSRVIWLNVLEGFVFSVSDYIKNNTSLKTKCCLSVFANTCSLFVAKT